MCHKPARCHKPAITIINSDALCIPHLSSDFISLILSLRCLLALPLQAGCVLLASCCSLPPAAYCSPPLAATCCYSSPAATCCCCLQSPNPTEFSHGGRRHTTACKVQIQPTSVGGRRHTLAHFHSIAFGHSSTQTGEVPQKLATCHKHRPPSGTDRPRAQTALGHYHSTALGHYQSRYPTYPPLVF